MNQLGLLRFILLYASPIMLRPPFIQNTARSFTHVSFHSQLQTSWFDKFRRFIWVVLRVILFCPAVLQILFINIIVGRGFASKYACKEINRIILRLHQSEAVSILKLKL